MRGRFNISFDRPGFLYQNPSFQSYGFPIKIDKEEIENFQKRGVTPSKEQAILNYVEEFIGNDPLVLVCSKNCVVVEENEEEYEVQLFLKV